MNTSSRTPALQIADTADRADIDQATAQAAARTVAAHAHDAADRDQLLTALGLPTPVANPRIARPVVTIANATSTRRIARCGHCPWEYTNTVKSDVEMHARYHRGAHRDGRIPGRAA